MDFFENNMDHERGFESEFQKKLAQALEQVNKPGYVPLGDSDDEARIAAEVTAGRADWRREMALEQAETNGVPAHYQSFKLGDFDIYAAGQEEALERVVGFVETAARLYEAKRDFLAMPRDGLFLHGACGTGKTTLAAYIGNFFSRHAVPARFELFGDILERYRSTMHASAETTAAAITRRLVDVPVLIIDDLGQTQLTAYSAETLFKLVNGRINRGGLTIITSNFDLPGLEKRLSAAQPQTAAAIISRFHSFEVVRLPGDDYRKRKK